MTRVIGPPRSRRRRWTFVWCLVVTLGVSMFFIAGAQAVHDTGVFQLDGNADQSVVSGYPAGTEDWTSICKANASTCTSSGKFDIAGAPTTSSEKSTFVTDAFNASSDNIYKGGTDDADISNWQWKQATPSPNKADLEHAYAAQYQIPANGSPEAGHQVLFFGGDRYANNGDTNIGLWFFQKPVTLDGTNSVTNADGSISCPVSSGCGFKGLHTAGNISLGGNKPGDIFILSAFTGGGTEPGIKIFEWVGNGNATKNYLGTNNCFTNACSLQPLAIPNTPGFSDNRCATTANAVSGDEACAIVNSVSTDSPWTFQDQTSGAPANVFGANEFYEGGLDLTGLGFTNVCFSSVLLNTRSSQSGTSALQDFALGNFGGCGSTVKTTPSVGANGITLPTTATTNPSAVNVTDSALVTVTGPSTFSGTLSFHICGPTATTATDLCTTGGVAAGSQTVTANGSYSSSSVKLTEAGRYCWRGDFSPTSPTDLTGASDSASSECFVVNPVTPSLSTNASSGPVSIGTAISDTANLTGTANKPGTGGGGTDGSINPVTNGAVAGGTITFNLYGPNDATCSGSVLHTKTVNVAGDSSASNVYSDSFTPTSAGTYRWVASYSGNSPNTNSKSGACNDANESVVVNPVQPSIVTSQTAGPVALGTAITDSATLSGTAKKPDGTNAGGTITFTLYGPQADPAHPVCTGTAVYTSTAYAVSGDGTYPTIAQAAASFTPTTAGTYNWVATYSGDLPNTLGVASGCADEPSLIIQLQPTISTAQRFVPNDSATISVASGGGNLAGNVDFKLFVNSTTCSNAAVYDSGNIDITTGTGTGLSRTVSSSNTTSYSTSGTTFSWLVTYTSTNTGHKNVTSTCNTENSSITITNG